MTPIGIVWLIITLTAPGQPDQTVSVATNLTPLQCNALSALYAAEWLRDQPAWAGFTIKAPGGVKCSSRAEGSA